MAASPALGAGMILLLLTLVSGSVARAAGASAINVELSLQTSASPVAAASRHVLSDDQKADEKPDSEEDNHDEEDGPDCKIVKRTVCKTNEEGEQKCHTKKYKDCAGSPPPAAAPPPPIYQQTCPQNFSQVTGSAALGGGQVITGSLKGPSLCQLLGTVPTNLVNTSFALKYTGRNTPLPGGNNSVTINTFTVAVGPNIVVLDFTTNSSAPTFTVQYPNGTAVTLTLADLGLTTNPTPQQSGRRLHSAPGRQLQALPTTCQVSTAACAATVAAALIVPCGTVGAQAGLLGLCFSSAAVFPVDLPVCAAAAGVIAVCAGAAYCTFGLANAAPLPGCPDTPSPSPSPIPCGDDGGADDGCILA